MLILNTISRAHNFWHRLLAIICILMLGFSGNIVAATGIGRAIPNPARDFFTSPDGSMCEMPCLFGIRAGYTTVGEAIHMIRTHPLTRTFVAIPKSAYWHYNIYSESQIRFIGDGGQIVFISLYAFPKFYPLPKSDLFSKNYEFNDEIITAVRLGSIQNDGYIPNIPKIPDALEQSWHGATFTAMSAVAGIPEYIGLPIMDLYGLGYLPMIYLESFYFDKGMIVTHFPSNASIPATTLNNNPLSSVVLIDRKNTYHYSNSEKISLSSLRFSTGFPNSWDCDLLSWQGLHWITRLEGEFGTFFQGYTSC